MTYLVKLKLHKLRKNKKVHSGSKTQINLFNILIFSQPLFKETSMFILSHVNILN